VKSLLFGIVLLCGCAGTRYVCSSVCLDKYNRCRAQPSGDNTGTMCDEQKQACLDCCKENGGNCGGNQ
jgi:hypothetical protein